MFCWFQAHHSEYDFKGGAGATSEMQQQVNKSRQKLDQDSPKTDVENDTSSNQNNLEDLPEVTPVRHSERTAGKRFKYLHCFVLFLSDSVFFLLYYIHWGIFVAFVQFCSYLV